MTTAAAAFVKRVAARTGWYRRHLARRTLPGVAVLCYHGLRDDALPAGSMAFENLHLRARRFASHCRALRACCHPISLDDWRGALRGERELPPRPVLITFDDGYRSVLTIGKPILDEYDLPAVVFVATDPVEHQRAFWYEVAARRRGEGAVEPMKAWPYDRWRDEYQASAEPAAADDPGAPLTPAGVRALADRPGIEIGSHSMTHPILARAPRHVQVEELAGSRSTLEAWTGRPVRAFAYPNGRPGIDYTRETVSLVQQQGFDAAFTTGERFASTGGDPLERPRFVILDAVSDAELLHRLGWSWPR